MGIAYYDSLPNKPLVEAILEIKWGQANEPDPAYEIIVGRLYEKVRAQYPVTEKLLPITQVPADMTIHVVRHRFRVTAGGWPLVQVGPGVLTLNDTEGYQWEDFRRRALELSPKLRESHPEPEALDITGIMLRYIDALEFDFEHHDVREFLREKLHIGVSVPETLFRDQPVFDRPTEAMLQLGFPIATPTGRVQLNISTGRKSDRPALVWNTVLVSAGEDARQGWSDFPAWLNSAHAILRHWFFALIEGELLQEFMRE